MNNNTDNLKDLWQNARRDDNGEPPDAQEIVAIAKQQIRSSIKLQLSTIVILTITALSLFAFFICVAQFRHTLSHIGESLMIGGLVVRIIIELFSIYRSSNIDLTKTALSTANESLAYTKLRKQINGPVTISIVILYTIGFYMLTPEFSLYFSTETMILIDLSYIIGAAVFIFFIRHGIKKENKILKEMIRIQNDITSEFPVR